MVSVSEDLSCELRKFTTSQFRSKVYSVPMSECYPVASTVLAQSPQGPIRGLFKPSPLDSDDDEDPAIPSPRHSTVPAPSQVVTRRPAHDKSTVPPPVHDVIPVQELPYLQPLSHHPALQPLLQTARFFLVHHLNLLLLFLQGGLAANEVPHFGTTRTGT